MHQHEPPAFFLVFHNHIIQSHLPPGVQADDDTTNRDGRLAEAGRRGSGWFSSCLGRRDGIGGNVSASATC